MMGAQWGKPETQIGSESTPLLATAFQCGANATKEIKDVDKGTMFSGYFPFLKDLHWSCTDAVIISKLRDCGVDWTVEKGCSRIPLRTIFTSSSTSSSSSSSNPFNPNPPPRVRAVSHVAFPAVEKPHKRLAAVPPHPIYIILEEAFRLCVRNHNITLPRFCLSPHSLICMPLCQHYGSNHFSKSERFLYWGKSIIFEQSTQH